MSLQTTGKDFYCLDTKVSSVLRSMFFEEYSISLLLTYTEKKINLTFGDDLLAL